MSSFTFRLPDIGEGVVEGEIVRVLVKVGDIVKEDQVLAEVMTDKATVQIPSPKNGRIETVHVEAGQMIPVEAAMFTIAVGEGAPVATAAPAAPVAAAPVKVAAVPSSSEAVTRAIIPAVSAPKPPQEPSRVLATPATRKMARDNDIDIKNIAGTGKDGRVTKNDIEDALRERTAPAYQAPALTPSAPTPVVKRTAHDESVLEERIPLRGLRKTIAQNMVRSKFTAPHFTYVEEVDVTSLVALRERVRPLAESRGVKLSYLPFITKAILAAMREFPIVNSAMDDTAQEVVLKHYFHMGIAISTDQGLAVLVIRDADKKSIMTIAREIEDLSAKVREGRASREEMTGSTFTISSLGKLGGLLATPILNYPEAAILGVHKIEERPVIRNREIVIRDMMNLSLSFDHRIIDGFVGASFTAAVARFLENPDLLFVEGM